MLRATLLCAWLLALVSAPGFAKGASGRRPMKVDDLFRFKRVSDPQVSPDGKLVAYVLGTVDLDKNSTSSSIWLARADGGRPRQLTNAAKKDRHPRWSPDGKWVLF